MRFRHGVLVLLGLTFAVFANAGPCTPDNLQNYVNNQSKGPGFGCTLANLEYFNFFFQSAGTGQVQPDLATNLTVTPGATGLTFTGFQSLNPNVGSLQDFIGLNVDPAPVLTGDSISLDPPLGGIQLDLYACLGATPFFVGKNTGNLSDTNLYCGANPTFDPVTAVAINLGSPNASIVNNGNPLQTSTFNLAASTGQLGVLLRLTLNTTSVAGASLDGIGNQPLQQAGTPEPGSWLLLGSGLAALLLRSLRAKRLS